MRVSYLRVQHRQQRLPQLLPQQRITLVKRGAEEGLGFIEFTAHRHILGTLPGEEKSHGRRAFMQGNNARADPPAQQAIDPLLGNQR